VRNDVIDHEHTALRIQLDVRSSFERCSPPVLRQRSRASMPRADEVGERP
jgi:hypothetical protein